jgi:hypothetical protein
MEVDTHPSYLYTNKIKEKLGGNDTRMEKIIVSKQQKKRQHHYPNETNNSSTDNQHKNKILNKILNISNKTNSTISIAKVFPNNNNENNKNENEFCSKENQSFFQFENNNEKYLTRDRRTNSIKLKSCELKNVGFNIAKLIEYKDKFKFLSSIELMTIMKIIILILLIDLLPTTTTQKLSVLSTTSPHFNFRYKDSNSNNNNNNYNSNNHSSNMNMNSRLIRIDGDIILGGIFPMHEHLSQNRDYPCGAIKEEKGIQRLEAMLFATDRINKDPTILRNITLGSLVIDSCSSDTYALEQSMEFVRYYMNQVRN